MSPAIMRHSGTASRSTGPNLPAPGQEGKEKVTRYALISPRMRRTGRKARNQVTNGAALAAVLVRSSVPKAPKSRGTGRAALKGGTR
jgi:hypothetical protein